MIKLENKEMILEAANTMALDFSRSGCKKQIWPDGTAHYMIQVQGFSMFGMLDNVSQEDQKVLDAAISNNKNTLAKEAEEYKQRNTQVAKIRAKKFSELDRNIFLANKIGKSEQNIQQLMAQRDQQVEKFIAPHYEELSKLHDKAWPGYTGCQGFYDFEKKFLSKFENPQPSRPRPRM